MSFWRFLLGCASLLFAGLAQAQPLPPEQEAERLRAAGFPIIDVDARLSGAERQQLLLELEWLQVCCELDLVFVLQDQSLLGTARADLVQLQQQLLRTGLWTDQTALLLIQSDPPLAEVARSATLRANTAALSPEALDELGRQAATPDMVPRLMQVLRAVSQGEVPLGSGQETEPLFNEDQQALAFHLGILLAAFVLGLLALSLFRRLPRPLAGRPTASQALPREFGRTFVRVQAVPTPRPAVLFLSISGRRRHLGLCLTIAALIGLGGWAVQDVWQFEFYGALGFDTLQQLWLFRALLSLAAAALVLGVLARTPLGAWLTPPWVRRSLLARQLRQRVGGFPGPVLVWRRVAGRLELWNDAQLGDLSPTYVSAFERLAQDASHGHADQGLERFQKHAERYSGAR